ncbi:hypothetical protein [uncultured Methanofollis sp.]|uniref:hypothetical protein n=1 Tax=uncultured Methanofollis sp. TaxID=262500 RepID=UPI002604D2DF|nr:hypothetical protein [uncultured Methanofollis sp.]
MVLIIYLQQRKVSERINPISFSGMKIVNIVCSGDLHQPVPFPRLPELRPEDLRI